MNNYGWTATVTRVGRWSYRVGVAHVAFGDEIWTVFGRARAERKARRILARRALYEQRLTDTWTVGDDDE